MRTMKKYPLEALALYGANGFMRGMAKTVLGLAGFGNFELFDDESVARRWLEQGGHPDAGGAPAGAPAPGSAGRLRRLAVPAGLVASALVVRRRRRRRRAAGGAATAG